MRTICCLTLLLFTACDDTESATQDDAAAMIEPDAAPPQPDATPPEPDAALEDPLLEVSGIEPAIDHDPTPGVVEFHLRAARKHILIARDMAYEGYAYNDQMPGPLLQARIGDEIVVHFTNDLPEPTTIHWHGLRVPNDMDGNPRIQTPVQPGETFTYRFIARDAGTYWYHPHVRTNEQLEKGLYGPIVIQRAEEPEYDLERVLVLDDILWDEDGLPPFLASMPERMHGRFGNVMLTNGRAEAIPGTAKQGQVELWRIMNTANARTMSLEIDGASFRVVGTDGGPLSEPYETDQLLVPVGQRYNVEIRYDEPGTVSLQSLLPRRNAVGQIEFVPFTMFEVEVEETGDSMREVPFVAGEPLPFRRTNTEAELVFDAVNGPNGLEWQLNGQTMPEDPLFTFQEGDTVRFTLVNKQAPEHPFHLHGQFMTITPDGRAATEQPGLKDTVLVPGRSTVEVTAYMDNPGRWMAHCHILEHAALGMMAEFVVEDAD